MPAPRFLALLLLAPALSWAQGVPQCGPSQIGQPCPEPGVATAGGAGPALNLGAGNPIHLATGNKYQRDTDLPALSGPLGLEIVRHYNSLDPRGGPLGRGWTLSYDTRVYRMGTMAQIVQADGSRLDFALGPGPGCRPTDPAAGSLLRRADGWTWRWPTGRVLQFDAGGRLSAIATAEGERLEISRHPGPGPLRGAILAVTDPRGRALRMVYDTARGPPRLARIETPLGPFEYRHDTPAGAGQPRLAAVRRPDGMERRYLAEPARQAGHPYALTGIVLADARGRRLRIQTWAYDARGRAVLSAGGEPGTAAGRVEIEYAAPPAAGRPGLTRVRSRDGTTEFRIAVRGGRHVLASVRGAPCPGCMAPGLHAGYDSAGRLRSLNGLRIGRRADGSVARLDLTGAAPWPALRLDYDSAGRLLRWRAGAIGGERRRYDAQGRLAERRFANGDLWRYRYDAAGRPVVWQAVGAQAPDRPQTVRIAWRGMLPVRIEHPAETETLAYDARGALVRREIRRPGAPGRPPFRYAERYLRDEAGRLVRHELPEGGALRYRRDTAGALSAIDWVDASGRRHAVLAAEPGGYAHGNGLRTAGRLRAGRLDALVVADPRRAAGAPVFAQVLRYDGAGRIAAEILDLDGRREAWRYGHDAAGRLAAWSRFARNRPGADLPAGPAAVSPAESSAKPTADSAGAAIWQAWLPSGASAGVRGADATRRPGIVRDASGLPLRVGARRLGYGPGRRLAAVDEGGRRLAAYAHNAYGARIHRQAGGISTHFLFLDHKVAAEARPVAGRVRIVRRYVHAGQVPVAFIDYDYGAASACPDAPGDCAGAAPTGRLYAIHADAAGMPRVVTDDRQRVRWRAAATPFGLAEPRGDLELPLRLPGQWFDAATGWHDNFLRTYDPVQGHYLEPDPLGPAPGTSAYGYAAQQPRRYADPLGLMLFAFDGTRNLPADASNVWLLSRVYADGAAYYEPGPGTSGARDWDAATGASGYGIVLNQWDRLLAALHARAPASTGVPVDLLGFSRGAALARDFGARLAAHLRNGRFWVRDDGLGVVTACMDLRFMGLFDTVAQFGLLGSGDRAYDLASVSAWDWVAHAVALNERRWLFPLTVLATPEAGNVVEAPFLGAHADIGGGYLNEPGGGDLSDVALNWMLWQARAAGAAFGDLAPEQARVSRPLLHDERSPALRSVQNGDRRVDGPDGRKLLDYQDDHRRYGSETRRQVEAFVARAPGWISAGGNVAGTVDMRAYGRWLEDVLGMPGDLLAPAGTGP